MFPSLKLFLKFGYLFSHFLRNSFIYGQTENHQIKELINQRATGHSGYSIHLLVISMQRADLYHGGVSIGKNVGRFSLILLNAGDTGASNCMPNIF